MASVTQPQIEAISANRSLLADSDPVPDLVRMLADALRASLVEAETGFSATYDKKLKQLESAESWQKIEQADRNRILKDSRIEKISKGATGTEQEVLESLGRIPLDDWQNRTAALTQLFYGRPHQSRQIGRAENPSFQAPQSHASHAGGCQGLARRD